MVAVAALVSWYKRIESKDAGRGRRPTLPGRRRGRRMMKRLSAIACVAAWSRGLCRAGPGRPSGRVPWSPGHLLEIAVFRCRDVAQAIADQQAECSGRRRRFVGPAGAERAPRTPIPPACRAHSATALPGVAVTVATDVKSRRTRRRHAAGAAGGAGRGQAGARDLADRHRGCHAGRSIPITFSENAGQTASTLARKAGADVILVNATVQPAHRINDRAWRPIPKTCVGLQCSMTCRCLTASIIMKLWADLRHLRLHRRHE